MRQTMPSERNSVTRKMRIGDFKGYATLGYFEDGRPGELFFTLHKAGSVEHGMCHALGLVISLALQSGVPLSSIANKLTGLQFEPRGFTGATDIPLVTSIADYLGKWLSSKELT